MTRWPFGWTPTDSTSDRYVDLIVVDTEGGFTAWVENFDKYQHTIVIDEQPNVLHHGCIWFTGSTAAETETDTGVDFHADTEIKGARIEIVTVDSGETINVGLLSTETNGDMDGLLDGISTTTAGYVKEVFATRGALLDDGTDIYMMGHYVTTSQAESLSYSTSKGTDTAAGYIHYDFVRVR